MNLRDSGAVEPQLSSILSWTHMVTLGNVWGDLDPAQYEWEEPPFNS